MNELTIEVLESKIGVPALQVNIDGKNMMLHSKYNPIQEAERFIDSLKERIDEADHVLFYGVGLGYHVRNFCETYSEKLVSAYEPIEQIAKTCIKEQPITKFPKAKLEHYIVESNHHPLTQNMEELSELVHQKMLLIVLPVYERIFSEQTKEFGEALKSFFMVKGSNIVAASLFSKRWTLNALMNLPETFKHENIILHKKKFFKNKPVILVSAGPSLDEELENLRIIKENRLAYIFAVGSAAKVLVLKNIYPDAICTYDPQPHNHNVFKEIYEQGITDIPMVYGTTVGFETLQFYQGPKLYFVTSQDRITPKFHKEQLPVISDAPTIALIMLQIFHALEVKKVYLVGQNLAFKKNQYYSGEIKRYDQEKKELTNSSIQAQDLINSFEVEDVHGGKVLTNDSLNRMRLDMEMYIDFVKMDIINTTNGGVAIKGAKFRPLQQLMEEELKERVVVDKWWDSLKGKKVNELNQEFKGKYGKEFEVFVQTDKELENYLDDFKQSLMNMKENQIKQKLESLGKLFEKYQRNLFFLTTISPIAKLAFEKLNAEKQIISKMNSSIEKVERTIQVYNDYLNSCRAFYRDLAPIIKNLTLSKLGKQPKIKNYGSTSGVFHYVGEWNKKYHTLKENEELNLSICTIGAEAKEKDAQIAFQFCGTSLKIFGTNHSQNGLKLQVTIDGEVNTSIITKYIDENKYGSFMHQKLYEVLGLEGEMHNVEISILSDNPSFVFEGIEIDSSGRAYHIDEVMSVEELEIGKRIRCHYKANYNTVGEISGFGEEIGQHLSTNPEAKPDGDFYFIVVDEVDEGLKLISDRVTQNYVSWPNLLRGRIPLGSHRANFREISEQENEWEKYLLKQEYEANFEDVFNHTANVASWTNFAENGLKTGYKVKDLVTIKGQFYHHKPYGNSPDFTYSIPDTYVYRFVGYRPVCIINKKDDSND